MSTCSDSAVHTAVSTQRGSRRLQPFIHCDDDIKQGLPAWVSLAALWCVQSEGSFNSNNQCCVRLCPRNITLRLHAAPPKAGATSQGSHLAAAAIPREATPHAQSFRSSL